MKDICAKPAPAHWLPKGLVCIRPKGHKVTGKRDGEPFKKEYMAHQTSDGRLWPIGRTNQLWA